MKITLINISINKVILYMNKHKSNLVEHVDNSIFITYQQGDKDIYIIVSFKNR